MARAPWYRLPCEAARWRSIPLRRRHPSRGPHRSRTPQRTRRAARRTDAAGPSRPPLSRRSPGSGRSRLGPIGASLACRRAKGYLGVAWPGSGSGWLEEPPRYRSGPCPLIPSRGPTTSARVQRYDRGPRKSRLRESGDVACADRPRGARPEASSEPPACVRQRSLPPAERHESGPTSMRLHGYS